MFSFVWGGGSGRAFLAAQHRALFPISFAKPLVCLSRGARRSRHDYVPSPPPSSSYRVLDEEGCAAGAWSVVMSAGWCGRSIVLATRRLLDGHGNGYIEMSTLGALLLEVHSLRGVAPRELARLQDLIEEAGVRRPEQPCLNLADFKVLGMPFHGSSDISSFPRMR